MILWGRRLFVKLTLLRNVGTGVTISSLLLYASSKAVLIHDVDSSKVSLGIGSWDDPWTLSNDLWAFHLPYDLGTECLLCGLLINDPLVFIEFDRLDFPERILNPLNSMLM
jgi:hypothetical protein